MNPVAQVFILAGSVLALLAGVGLLRFSTPYARFHAAGKASPVAFLLVAVGAGVEVGIAGIAQLVVAGAALVLTLPAATHLLFRATHRTVPSPHLRADALADAEIAARTYRIPNTGAPNTGAPNTSTPNTDTPNTSTPNTDTPNTSTPNTDNTSIASPEMPLDTPDEVDGKTDGS